MQPAPPPLERETLASTPSFHKIFDEEREGFLDELLEIPAVDALHGLDGAVRPSSEDSNNDDDGDEEFEFAVLCRDSFEGLETISADEIFSNGRILPIYPLFNRALVSEAQLQHQDRASAAAAAAAAAEQQAGKPPRLPLRKLMMEDRDPPSTSSSESDELEGIPAESYCLWTPNSAPPSPDLRRRSHSTGDSSKRWRLRDLVIGRSHSDGRKKFLFLAPAHPSSAEAAEKTSRRLSADRPPAAAAEEAKKGKGKGGVRVLEMDMVTAHRLYYGKGGAAAGDRRRSFLPYRRDLLGLFGNVNGADRSFHQPL